MTTFADIRQFVAERAKSLCEYCHCPSDFSSSPYAVDHIIPRAGGGTDDDENLAWSCQGCNGHKLIAIEAIDPATGSLVALYDPRRHVWDKHFQWSLSGLTPLGVSPTGRATIERLQLNRQSAVNLRRALKASGLYSNAS